MITFQTQITKQHLVKVDNMENVISTIEWVLTLNEGARVTTHAGKSDLDIPTGSFVSFSEVTEAQKLEWAFAKYNGQDAFVERVIKILNEAGNSISFNIPAPPPPQETFVMRKVVV
jgi:hypothetical protein